MRPRLAKEKMIILACSFLTVALLIGSISLVKKGELVSPAGESNPTSFSTESTVLLTNATPIGSFTATFGILPTVTIADSSGPGSATPTARIFPILGDCTATNVLGKITYLNDFQLYVMDGNGCFPKLLMKNASDSVRLRSPKWSPDGQRIATLCDIGEVCIFDPGPSLADCGNSTSPGGCRPVIEMRFGVCQGLRCYTNNLSWSPDRTRLAVTYEYYPTGNRTEGGYGICILSLLKGGCSTIFTDEAELWVDWSHIEDRLAVSNMKGEIFLIDPDGSNRVGLAYGINPAWSPDGKKIAYLKPSEDENKEVFGIASISVKGGEIEWLYTPAARDRHYRPPQTLGIGCDVRGLSWSPDGKYIVFQAGTAANMFNCYIMRLDLQTREIGFLTDPAGNRDNYLFSDPDWGP